MDFEKGRDKISIDGSYYEDIRREVYIGDVVRLKILESSTAVFLERSVVSSLSCIKIAEVSNEGFLIEMDITDFIFTGF